MNKIARLALECQSLANRTGQPTVIIERNGKLTVRTETRKVDSDKFLWGYAPREVKDD